MFYKYSQNNSGGRFVSNDDLAHRVVIEATSVREANSKAECIGIYFNGVEEGSDCECCGDRWYEPDELELTKEELVEYMQDLADDYGWTKPDAIIHLQDGSKHLVYKK